MKRLFKEVFRSLAKNKVTLVCLTILIFLTTFLFTLLNDVKTSYSRTINSYDKVSKLHDLTVDLDINPSGIIPRQGYDQIDSDNKKIVTKPIKFESSKNGSQISYDINLPESSQNFIKTSDIKNWNINKDYYISTEDFLKLYHEQRSNEVSSVRFEINSKNPNLINIKNFSFEGENRRFKAYKKENNKYILITEKIKISPNDIIKFKKPIKISDFLTISYAPKGFRGEQELRDAIIESSPLFINTKTKEASFLTEDYDLWKSQNTLAIIKADDVLKLMGFEKEATSSKWYFNEEKFKNAEIKLQSNKKTTAWNIHNEDLLENQFSLKEFASQNKIETNVPIYIEMKSNNTYSIPENWIRKLERLTYYNWYRYVLNWNENSDEEKSNWKGSYFKFINDFYNKSKDEYNKNKYFSYWDKTVKINYSIGNTSKETFEENLQLEKEDLSDTFKNAWIGGENNLKIPKNKQNLSKVNLWNIKQVEFNKFSSEKISDEEFADISNVNKLSHYQNLIRNGSLNFARTSILNDVKNVVGKENLGIRKTITVETVNDENAKKNVFHFVDTGDKDKKILNFENNVGKLYNETLSPTILHSSISNKNIDTFLLKQNNSSNFIQKIPSVYVRPLISTIFQNYTPNIAYFNADIRFEKYYNFLNSTQIPILTNGKILVLTTATPEIKRNIGSKIVGAIAMPKLNKYIFLKQSNIDGFSNEIVWNKVSIKNKEYLTLDEVYKYLVEQDYTIRGEIGPKGWAVVNNQFKNQINLPIGFGVISNDLTQEITQKNTITTLIKRLRSTLLNTDLAKLFDRQYIYRLFKAITDSVEHNELHKLLSIGKTNQFILEKTLLDIIKFLIKPIDQTRNKNLEYININANSFLHNFFNKILNYFKNKFLQSGNTKEAREKYLIEQINNLSSLLKFSDIYIIPQLKISLSDLLNYVKEKEKIFDILSDVFSSIDFIKFSSIIQSWFDLHPYKPFTAINSTYWTMSHERILVSLLSSIDEIKFKTAIKKLINLVDFSKILNPDLSSSYYNKWIQAHQIAHNELKEETKKQVKNFFLSLDGKKDRSYTNINEGLFSIFSNFSIEKFASSLNSLIKVNKYPIAANNKIYNDYNIEYLNHSDYLIAFMAAISSTNNENISFNKINQIQNALIKIFNLSSKTSSVSDELNISLPTREENKISLLDLAILPKLAFPQVLSDVKIPSPFNIPINKYDLVDVRKIISKVENAIEKNELIKLTKSEFEFVKNEALINEIELNNLNLLKTKLLFYYSFISKLKLQNLKPQNRDLDFVSDGIKFNPISYGDLAYLSALINEDNPNKKNEIEILKTIHSLLYKNLGSVFTGNKEEMLIKNQFVLYSLWIKLAYYLNRIEEAPDRIKIDEETGNRIIKKEFKKILSFDQIKLVLEEIYNFGNSEEVKKIITNYDNVINPIPSLGVFGSDNKYRATLLKIPYAHAHTRLANQELIKLIKNSPAIDKFKANLLKFKIDTKTIEKIIDLLIKNSNEITYNFGYIAASSQMSTFYIQSLQTFIKSFLKTEKGSTIKPLITNEYELDLAFKNATDNSRLNNSLSILNVPNNLLNPLTLLSFPQIPLYYLLSPNPNEGNIAYIVKKLFLNLKSSSIQDAAYQIESITHRFSSSVRFVESKNDDSVDLDLANFNYLFNGLLKNKNGNDLEFFGINITDTLRKTIFKIIEPIFIPSLISYTDSGSYLAKINYGYASKNNKEAYTGDISKYLSNPYEMQLFISSLDSKYKIKINTQEYLIIGIDSTADYLYPVVNEENIQVDTNSQAIVYVNSKGFDRIYSAYPTFAIKNYALVKSPVDSKGNYIKNKSPKELQNLFIKNINKINPNSFKKVYLKDELDNLNPERQIRVVTIRVIINSIKNATFYLITVLTILVAFIIYFIMKRYIEARNKVVGILGAQGYKASKIALAFCAFGWIPAVVGALGGYILGFVFQKPAMNILSSYWTLENNIIPIHFIAMFLTVIVPFIFVSLLIFIITSISVRKKPIELMSGLTEVNVGNFAQRISTLFRRLPIKTRFIASMALNNFWKMFSLFLAFSTTSLISMFFLSSSNIFDKAITKTYKDRLYKFKLDLESPTTEGGPYVTYNKNNIKSLLYVPNDLAGNTSSNGSQLDYDNPNFLRPGGSFNTDVVQKPYSPLVLTKSSLDILLDLSVELSPWDITYANMPETQRARVAQIFKKVSREMQNTQYLIDLTKLKNNENYLEVGNSYHNVIAVKNLEKFQADLKAGKPEDLSNRTSFFFFTNKSRYGENKGSSRINEQFKFIEWDPINEVYYKAKDVSTSRYRQEYRNFLINAYRRINGLDFFVSFGGVYWNNATNEKYTYAKALLDKKEIKIYGYYEDSRFISLHNKNNENLQLKLKNYKYEKNKNIPLVINSVAAQKYGLKIGSKIELDLQNHVDRFSHRALLQKAPQTKYIFEVIDISETYINTEFTTRKDILDTILGYDTLSNRLKDARKQELINDLALNPDKKDEITKQFNRKYDAFNGILSNDITPVQTIDTLTTYSSTGFWGAASSYDVEHASDKSVWDFFKRIFISDKSLNYVSVYENNINAYNEAHKDAKLDYKETLFKLLKINESQFERIVKQSNSNEEFKNLARNVVTQFYGTQPDTIYGKNIMYGASFDVNSKDIEAGFIEGISETVNVILIIFIVMSLIISIVILIVITNIMIASNQKSIATFSVLGYTNREKITLFFANFVPTIIFACLLMIPTTLLLISAFNAFMMATSQIVLPLVLHYSTIIISATICLAVFVLTSMATWKSLNKVKAIDVLKGK
ncbi:ABC transporter permease [Metamycoplasma canadense]|uniref:ABC transporter permease protein n=1 Tax=Metamycoplasma canadense TaxID=29554 RepID=A0A077L6C4_9BACT|nr:ABC transporter permease [Metamycoplasma canadense]BAP39512.1 ABC transporter permease protein [Metamycoplasma canadense]